MKHYYICGLNSICMKNLMLHGMFFVAVCVFSVIFIIFGKGSVAMVVFQQKRRSSAVRFCGLGMITEEKWVPKFRSLFLE